ncbi:MAG TPA: hypothetical protein VFE50_11960 [Cyclobacteriaceae bacterium]|nr:hypothetical protein [Cyclobacteriaceae bacterium]
MDALALCLYLLITGYITIYVGKVLFENGRHFLLQTFQEVALTDSVNRILLTGYYLINLGYVSIMLTVRAPVVTVSDLFASLGTSVGRILLTLGIMHFLNIAACVTWSKLNSKYKPENKF